MRGLSNTLWIVVVSIVIVVVALIILTIFAKVIPIFGSVTEFDNYCKTKGMTTCSSLGALPPDWDFEVSIGEGTSTCAKATGYSSCPAEWAPPAK
jgi:hypothetical protein